MWTMWSMLDATLVTIAVAAAALLLGWMFVSASASGYPNAKQQGGRSGVLGGGPWAAAGCGGCRERACTTSFSKAAP